ncbi:MAG: CHAD domain-containing protein [Acidimicrobiales bacterium]
MPFALDPRMPAGESLRWIVVDRLVDALIALQSVGTADAEADTHALFVARKRGKQARAAATLLPSTVGPDRRKFDRQVRKAARQLGPIRDAEVAQGTLGDLEVPVGSRGADVASAIVPLRRPTPKVSVSSDPTGASLAIRRRR